MKITELKNTGLNPNPHNVQVKKLYDTENAMVVHIMLKPGESLKRHKRSYENDPRKEEGYVLFSV